MYIANHVGILRLRLQEYNVVMSEPLAVSISNRVDSPCIYWDSQTGAGPSQESLIAWTN